MATGFENQVDIIPQESVIPTDYSFLSFALGQKESQYETGLQNVKSAYSAVTNLNLSNSDNIAARNEYLQNAKTQVQALSKADLSLPQNVEKAGQIFAPFWKDPDMISDISKTKQIQDANQVAETTRTSTDDKIRGTYDSRIVPYINQPLQQLKEAKRGDGSMQAIQTRQFVPFKDVKQHLDDEADKEDLEINWFDDPNGPYLIKHTNGKKSLQNYQTWAASKLGDDFNAQFNVIGTVNKEARVNDYVQRGMPRPDAENKVGTDLYNSVAQNYTDNLANWKQEAATHDAAIKNIFDKVATQKGGKMTPEQQDALDEIYDRRDLVRANIKKSQPEVDDFLQQDTKQDFIAHPENYLAKGVRQQIINDWSAGRAANESIDITPNQSYWNAKNLEEQYTHLKYEDNWHNMDHTVALGNLGVARFSAGMTNLDGSPKTQLTSDQGIAAGPATQLLKNIPEIDMYNNTMQFIKGKAYTGIFSPNGLISSTLSLPGITDEDIKNVNTYMSAVTKGNNIEGTPEMKQSFTKLNNALIGAGVKMDPNKDIISKYRDGLLQFAPLYQQQQIAAGKKDEATRIATIVSGVNQNLGIFNDQEEQRNQKTQAAINSDEYKNSPLVVNRNNKRDIINSDDMIKESGLLPIPVHTVSTNEKGEKSYINTTLTPKDITNAWLTGNIKKPAFGDPNQDVVVEMNGKKFIYHSDYDQLISGQEPRYDQMFNNLQSKYGNPGDLTKEYKKLVEKTIPDKSYYSGETGQLLMKRRYGFGKGEDGNALVTELADPDNSNHIYTDPSMAPGTEATAAEVAALRRKGGQDGPKDTFSQPVMVASGPRSNPVGVLSVNSAKKEQENDEDLKVIGGKTYYVDVKPDARSATLKNVLPNLEYNYQSPMLYNGKSVKSSPTEEAAGLKYTVTPDDVNNPKGATLNHTSRALDTKTGKEVEVNLRRYFSYDQYTPSTIMNGVQQMNAAYYNQEAGAQHERNRTGNTGMTLSEYKKSRGIN